MKKWAALGVLLLAGCANTEVVYMADKAGKNVQCGPYEFFGGDDRDAADLRLRNCVIDYQKAGYQRTPKP